MVLDNKNQLSVWAAIFFGCLAIVAFSILTGVSLGWLGALATFIVIFSAIAFVLKVASELK